MITKSGLAARYGTKVVRRVVARKSGGDDCYSWALYVDGRVYMNGMSQREAQSRMAAWVKSQCEREGGPQWGGK